MRKRQYKSLSEINVTNLVDVTMVLLIIFMITAPLLRSGIEVELPKAKAKIQKMREGILITYTRDGSIYIDSEKVLQKDFENRLIKKWSASGQTQVLLSADKEVSYGKVVNFMDRIKAVGISNLGLVIEPDLGGEKE